MTYDPSTAVFAALALAVLWTMVFSGVEKRALELKQRRRICPSCGRQIPGAVCREH